MNADEFSRERLKIEQIVRTERYSRDTAQWEKLRSFWYPDAEKTNIKITWFKGTIDGHIAGSRAMANKASLSSVKHIINPVDVTSIWFIYLRWLFIVHEDRALCEAYGQINTRPTLEGIQYDLSSSATFMIKFLRLNGEWKIISLECIYDKDNLVPVVCLPTRPLSINYPRESYKCLAHVLSVTGGYTVDPDLPGWDKPDQAQRLLKDARDWVAQS